MNKSLIISKGQLEATTSKRKKTQHVQRVEGEMLYTSQLAEILVAILDIKMKKLDYHSGSSKNTPSTSHGTLQLSSSLESNEKLIKSLHLKNMEDKYSSIDSYDQADRNGGSSRDSQSSEIDTLSEMLEDLEKLLEKKKNTTAFGNQLLSIKSYLEKRKRVSQKSKHEWKSTRKDKLLKSNKSNDENFSTNETQIIEGLASLQQVNPKSPIAYLRDALSYIWIDQFKDAISNLRIAFSIDPSMLDDPLMLALILASEKRIKLAEYVIRNRLIFSPGSLPWGGSTYTLWGAILIDNHQFADAEKILQEAVRISEKNVVAYGLLVEICLMQNRLNYAIELANKIKKIDCEDGYIILGVASEKDDSGEALLQQKTRQKLNDIYEYMQKLVKDEESEREISSIQKSNSLNISDTPITASFASSSEEYSFLSNPEINNAKFCYNKPPAPARTKEVKIYDKSFGSLEDFLNFFEKRGPKMAKFAKRLNQIETSQNFDALNKYIVPILCHSINKESEKNRLILGKKSTSATRELLKLFKTEFASLGQFYTSILKAYTLDGFLSHNLNRYLRNEDWIGLNCILPYAYCLCKAFLCPEITSGDSFYSDQSVDSFKLYRGEVLDKHAVGVYSDKVNSTFSWNSMISTSTNRNVAECFSCVEGNTCTDTPVLFVIEVPLSVENQRSPQMIDMKRFSQLQEEDEVVLRPGSSFYVKNFYKDENKVEITLRLLDNRSLKNDLSEHMTSNLSKENKQESNNGSKHHLDYSAWLEESKHVKTNYEPQELIQTTANEEDNKNNCNELREEVSLYHGELRTEGDETYLPCKSLFEDRDSQEIESSLILFDCASKFSQQEDIIPEARHSEGIEIPQQNLGCRSYKATLESEKVVLSQQVSDEVFSASLEGESHNISSDSFDPEFLIGDEVLPSTSMYEKARKHGNSQEGETSFKLYHSLEKIQEIANVNNNFLCTPKPDEVVQAIQNQKQYCLEEIFPNQDEIPPTSKSMFEQVIEKRDEQTVEHSFQLSNFVFKEEVHEKVSKSVLNLEEKKEPEDVCHVTDKVSKDSDANVETDCALQDKNSHQNVPIEQGIHDDSPSYLQKSYNNSNGNLEEESSLEVSIFCNSRSILGQVPKEEAKTSFKRNKTTISNVALQRNTTVEPIPDVVLNDEVPHGVLNALTDKTLDFNKTANLKDCVPESLEQGVLNALTDKTLDFNKTTNLKTCAPDSPETGVLYTSTALDFNKTTNLKACAPDSPEPTGTRGGNSDSPLVQTEEGNNLYKDSSPKSSDQNKYCNYVEISKEAAKYHSCENITAYSKEKRDRYKGKAPNHPVDSAEKSTENPSTLNTPDREPLWKELQYNKSKVINYDPIVPVYSLLANSPSRGGQADEGIGLEEKPILIKYSLQKALGLDNIQKRESNSKQKDKPSKKQENKPNKKGKNNDGNNKYIKLFPFLHKLSEEKSDELTLCGKTIQLNKYLTRHRIHNKANELPAPFIDFLEGICKCSQAITDLYDINAFYTKNFQKKCKEAQIELSLVKDFTTIRDFDSISVTDMAKYKASRVLIKLVLKVISTKSDDSLFEEAFEQEHVPYLFWLIGSPQKATECTHFLSYEGRMKIYETFLQIDSLLKKKLNDEILEALLEKIVEPEGEKKFFVKKVSKKNSFEENSSLSFDLPYSDSTSIGQSQTTGSLNTTRFCDALGHFSDPDDEDNHNRQEQKKKRKLDASHIVNQR